MTRSIERAPAPLPALFPYTRCAPVPKPRLRDGSTQDKTRSISWQVRPVWFLGPASPQARAQQPVQVPQPVPVPMFA